MDTVTNQYILQPYTPPTISPPHMAGTAAPLTVFRRTGFSTPSGLRLLIISASSILQQPNTPCLPWSPRTRASVLALFAPPLAASRTAYFLAQKVAFSPALHRIGLAQASDTKTGLFIFVSFLFLWDCVYLVDLVHAPAFTGTGVGCFCNIGLGRLSGSIDSPSADDDGLYFIGRLPLATAFGPLLELID
jgi:hypothetical protein